MRFFLWEILIIYWGFHFKNSGSSKGYGAHCWSHFKFGHRLRVWLGSRRTTGRFPNVFSLLLYCQVFVCSVLYMWNILPFFFFSPGQLLLIIPNLNCLPGCIWQTLPTSQPGPRGSTLSISLAKILFFSVCLNDSLLHTTSVLCVLLMNPQCPGQNKNPCLGHRRYSFTF